MHIYISFIFPLQDAILFAMEDENFLNNIHVVSKEAVTKLQL